MKTLNYLIDNLGWTNLANESQEIFRRFLAQNESFISDAPSDGKQYGRQDGAWTEVIGGGGDSRPYKVYSAKIGNYF